jgi:hypothetical protein
MKNVFFKPWVGKNYSSTGINGKKLLILGESHYCGENCPTCGKLEIDDKNCREFTTNVVNGFLKYKEGDGECEGWMNTYTKFGNIFYNRHLSFDEVQAFWDSIVFYNFVQSSTNGPRESPTSKEFTKSASAFFEILQEYKPDLIIVWGKRLWHQMPETNDYGKEKIMFEDQDRGPFRYYTIDQKKIPAFKIYHPSSSIFNYSWYDSINKAINYLP